MEHLKFMALPILRHMAKWAWLTLMPVVVVAVCMGAEKAEVSPLKKVQLSLPSLTGQVSLEQALAKRRSVRRFTNQPISFEQIGQLAWAGQGITEPKRGFRTAPSAGAIYPMKLYFATQQGLFVYNPAEHSLERTLNRDIRAALATAALGQQTVADAACDIIIAGSQKKLAAKYRDRAKRYMLLEAGHIAQNIQLQVVCLGLGAVPVGAFDINQVRKLCSLPRDLEPLLIIPVGHLAEQKIVKKDITR